jgi:hypothetical protein
MIPDNQCPCYATEIISAERFFNLTQFTTEKASKLILDYINKKTLSYRHLCASFTLERIILIKKVKKNKSDIYQFVLKVRPSQAWFEVSLKLNDQKELLINDEVNRLSPYGNSADCIDNPIFKNFCYCLSRKFLFYLFL